MSYTAQSSLQICLVTVCLQDYLLALPSSAAGPCDLAQFSSLKGHKEIPWQTLVVRPTACMKADGNDS